MNRKTFDGTIVSYNEMTHQHLSNIIWFEKIFRGEIEEFNIQQLYARFGGKILPYQPHPEFKAEIEGLKSREMLIPGMNGMTHIVYKGQPVGYIWNEVPNFTNILGIQPLKLVGFTRLDRVKIGDQVVLMIDRKLDVEVQNWAYKAGLVKKSTYTVEDVKPLLSGDTAIRLKDHDYWQRLQRFARWVPNTTSIQDIIFNFLMPDPWEMGFDYDLFDEE